MRKLTILLMAVLFCSLSAWSQSSMIVNLGTEVLSNNTLSSAKQSFRHNAMPLEIMPSGKYGYLSEHPLLMAVVDFEGDAENSITEIDFLCSLATWYGIEDSLESAGYSLIKTGNATLGNGDMVPQEIYSKGSIICLVQTIDRNNKQIIFKHKPKKLTHIQTF